MEKIPANLFYKYNKGREIEIDDGVRDINNVTKYTGIVVGYHINEPYTIIVEVYGDMPFAFFGKLLNKSKQLSKETTENILDNKKYRWVDIGYSSITVSNYLTFDKDELQNIIDKLEL